MFVIDKWAGIARIMRRGAGDIRFRLMHTFLATNPFGTLALIIMSVAGEAIAVWAKRYSVLVKAALEAGRRLVIHLGVTDPDST
jgi:hypothetical protein